ncbi:unnamed protein product [Cunninghamella echinulata]
MTTTIIITTIIDEQHHNFLCIENQRDCVLPRSNNDKNRLGRIVVYFNSHYLCLSPSVIYLKKFYLDFENENKKSDICYYIFNETILDSIASTCIPFIHLILHKFNLDNTNMFNSAGLLSTTNFNNIDLSS